MINRRETIQRLSLLLGGALSTQVTAGLMGQVLNKGASLNVDDHQRALLADLTDVIIPDTGTPGAKAAGVEEFIIRVMRDCYELKDQQFFYAGLAELDAGSQAAHQKSFVDLESPAKQTMVKDLIKSNRPFFNQMRQLTVTGYFTSEIGATQALDYLPVPGRFEGDIPLTPEQKTWALR